MARYRRGEAQEASWVSASDKNRLELTLIFHLFFFYPFCKTTFETSKHISSVTILFKISQFTACKVQQAVTCTPAGGSQKMHLLSDPCWCLLHWHVTSKLCWMNNQESKLFEKWYEEGPVQKHEWKSLRKRCGCLLTWQTSAALKWDEFENDDMLLSISLKLDVERSFFFKCSWEALI